MPTNERTSGQRWPGKLKHFPDDEHGYAGLLRTEDRFPVLRAYESGWDKKTARANGRFIAAAWNAADALGWKTPEDCARGAELWREMVRTLKDIAAYDDVPASNTLYATGDYSYFDEPNAVEKARALLAKLGGKEG